MRYTSKCNIKLNEEIYLLKRDSTSLEYVKTTPKELLDKENLKYDKNTITLEMLKFLTETNLFIIEPSYTQIKNWCILGGFEEKSIKGLSKTFRLSYKRREE